LKTLVGWSSQEEFLEFKKEVKGILSKATDHYTSLARSYDAEIQGKYKLLLEKEIN
jgi:hypothetical protein